jgi:hypothetical protein
MGGTWVLQVRKISLSEIISFNCRLINFINPIETLLNELAAGCPGNLTIASLTAWIDSFGLGRLYESGKVKRMIGSYVGENKVRLFADCAIQIILYQISHSLTWTVHGLLLIELRTHVLHGGAGGRARASGHHCR